MSRIGLLVFALAVALLSTSDARADDEKPSDAAPRLEFPSDTVIARANGTVLYFYRPSFATPQELESDLRETLGLEGLTLRSLRRLGLLVLDGLPDAIAVALDAIPYFDVAPLQVQVDVKIVRTKRWEEEAPDTHEGQGDDAEDDGEGDEDDDEEGEIERRGHVETLAMPSVVVSVGSFAEVSLDSARPVLAYQSANQGGVNRLSSVVRTSTKLNVKALQVGDSSTILELAVTLEDLDPNSALVVPDGVDMSKTYRLRTTVTIPDGESIVVSGVRERRTMEDEGDAVPPPTGPGLAPLTPGREEAASDEEIVVVATATIVRRSSQLAPPSRPSHEGDDEDDE